MRHLYIYYQHYHMGFLPVFIVGSQFKETWQIVLRAYFFRYYDLNQPYPVSHTISDTLETIPFCYQFMEDFPHHKAEPRKNVPNHCWAQEYIRAAISEQQVPSFATLVLPHNSIKIVDLIYPILPFNQNW
jgi:hypothetical protein